jgi:hypothetical protein
VKPVPERRGASHVANARWVEQACNRFEATWKQVSADGGRPRVQDFLTDAPEPARADLLRELILLDIHYRIQDGEAPRTTDYQDHFATSPAPEWLETACLPTKVVQSPGEHEASRHRDFEFLGSPEGPGEIGRLAHYRILKVLGKGGMGVVFLAEDSQLRRPVALKVLRPGAGASLLERRRFLREARAIATLQHDHIISIYQIGQENDVPFLAMPYLEGESLETRLKREPRLPVQEILRIGREIVQGLEMAHRHDFIHRDIKPSNIWLEAPGDRVKLLDFGLVRPLGDETQLTPSGYVVGTPGCMAPEQATGKPVDRRTDLFSLGCVLYRMTTGEWPFRASGTTSLLEALTTLNPSPPHVLNPELPGELSDLILQLLAKDPAQRPPSAEAVVAHLQSIADEHSSRIVTRQVAVGSQALSEPTAFGQRETAEQYPQAQLFERRSRRWRWLVVGVTVGVLCVLAILVYWMTS